MGRSKGGLTTKVHALLDAAGRLIKLKITPGQAHDGRSADNMLDSVGPGCTLLADRAYDSDRLHAELASRGASANIRAVRNRKAPPPFDVELYKQRNVVERFFNQLKHFRAVATRYDKRDDNYLASIKLAVIRMQLRRYESVT